MQIETIRLRNFKVFRDVEITKMPAMCVFVGANGSGKSTLFDVFGFLRDALTHNVYQALSRRGGYKEVVSRESDGPIGIELQFRTDGGGPLVTYGLDIGLNERGRPVVDREVLRYKRGERGAPWHFLDFKRGKGKAIVNEADFEKKGVQARREPQQLESPDILAIKGLGQFERFQKAAAFRRLIENWHVSDFHISDARPSQEAGVAEHLSPRGDNLPLVAQYLYQNQRKIFSQVLRKMAARVPGVSKVEAAETEDGRIVLKFRDGKFRDPFIAKYVSDGTIKMFAYLLLLHDPSPHPLLCVEEPENQLYPHLLQELAEEFRLYANRGQGQVFVSTHSPEFLNACELGEVVWLVKRDGYAEVRRARADEQIARYMSEGDKMGYLWKQGFFEGADPQ
jgi:predicted ATPase